MRPLLLTLLLAACVPKGRFELAQIQLEATQTAFQTREEKSLRATAEARQRADDLAEDLTERELQVEALQERVAELERQADKRAEQETLNFLAGVEACPPLPEIPPCPACEGDEGEPVDPDGGTEEPNRERPPIEPEDPEVIEKRAYVKASIEEVSQALKRSVRFQTREAERNKQHQVVFERLSKLVDDGYAEIFDTGDETVVRLLTAKLFNENRTTLSPLGEELVKRLALGMNGLDGYRVHIVGHTDDRPVSSVEHPSNWELGFAYAIGLLRGLEYEGFELDATVTSLAGTDPVVKKKTKEARRLNRRVELRLSFDREILDRPVEKDEGEGGENGQPEDGGAGEDGLDGVDPEEGDAPEGERPDAGDPEGSESAPRLDNEPDETAPANDSSEDEPVVPSPGSVDPVDQPVDDVPGEEPPE